MTAPGTKRQIYEQKLGMEKCDSMNVSLQMGTNKMASQQGMTVYGLGRQVYDPKYCGNGEQLNLSEDYNSHNSQDYCD
ncbi:Calponin-1 [Acipenser ruthenus]|uniref:Calponin-1 n=2 Tax=Acipenser ruthenus TaxID=7906 RepID=A0A444USF9_ACIRT|nr:Calponin-1 [Acipenser ruthenus]